MHEQNVCQESETKKRVLIPIVLEGRGPRRLVSFTATAAAVHAEASDVHQQGPFNTYSAPSACWAFASFPFPYHWSVVNTLSEGWTASLINQSFASYFPPCALIQLL